MSRAILITGGCGFIGSHFIDLAVNKFLDHQIVVIDAMFSGSNIQNISTNLQEDKIVFYKESILSRSFLENIFIKHNIVKVFHFAAESHVDRSIKSPKPFIMSNILGTFELIDVAFNYWDANGINKHLFFHISTDEVYGELGFQENPFTESNKFMPNSPYSASKASSDLLVRAYHQTYGVNTITTNCSNNFGSRQDREKLIPTTLASIFQGIKIPVYGNGLNIRDWLYVKDHVNIIYQLSIQDTLYGQSFNIGSNNEKANLELIISIINLIHDLHKKNNDLFKSLKISNSLLNLDYEGCYEFVEDRKGHDTRYAVDNSLLLENIGQFSFTDFENSLRDTIRWYLMNQNRLYNS